MNYPGDYSPYDDQSYRVLGAITMHDTKYWHVIPTKSGRFYAGLVHRGGYIKTTKSRLRTLWWRLRYGRSND